MKVLSKAESVNSRIGNGQMKRGNVHILEGVKCLRKNKLTRGALGFL